LFPSDVFSQGPKQVTKLVTVEFRQRVEALESSRGKPSVVSPVTALRTPHGCDRARLTRSSLYERFTALIRRASTQLLMYINHCPRSCLSRFLRPLELRCTLSRVLMLCMRDFLNIRRFSTVPILFQ